MKIGIIGFGNLGHALAEGLIRSALIEPGDINIYNRTATVCQNATAKYGVFACSDVNQILAGSDIIFLVVKGYALADMAPSIDRALLTGKTVVSFMAGMDFAATQALIGKVNLVRAMPSLSIATCDGVIGYTAAPETVKNILEHLGYAFEVAPEDIEKVTAFSACGLGFAAYLIDAFASAGIQLGFSPEESTKIASQTFKNAIDRGDYKNTVRAVATKGGATEQGVLHMDSQRVYDIVANAVQAAYDKMV
jgi:pyrroline-5-carboxylate reductase